MSIPSIFYVSTEDQASEMEMNHDLAQEDVAELGGIDTLKLSTLYAIAIKREWDVDLMDTFSEVRTSDSEWIYEIPKEFTKELEGTDLDAASAEWAETEEMACEPEDAKYVIDVLLRMAKRSEETGKPLYIYTTL
ncbi:hypothetical protein [Pelagicoccus sp. SDUM812002]|uniref:hypothetical protein n=1 Tax=Pelagicoccus sp. SDUM812002 TaxID=3041266 RepID=UPI00280EF6E1|nr:hypothetical protein [Pelagicoccus sp. SDUM812002]MDQ8188539.1 hypothetical protein [Pelagicoccus sp. SDUM812002]